MLYCRVFHQTWMKIVVLLFKFDEQQWKSLYRRSKSMEIDEGRCTIMSYRQQSMKIVGVSFKIDDCFFWKPLYCRAFASNVKENNFTRSCIFIENRWASLYYHSKPFKINEKRCPVVRLHWTSMNIVVLSCVSIEKG